MLPIKKIYVDTRQRSPDSNSHSDFHIDLPTTILMPEDTGFYIEDICIPVSWWPVEENVNDYFFFQTMGSVSLVVITPGNYTTEELGTEIVKQMNSVFGATPRFASEYRKSQNAIVIKFLPAYIGNDNLQVFRILTDNDLKLTAWNLDRYFQS